MIGRFGVEDATENPGVTAAQVDTVIGIRAHEAQHMIMMPNVVLRMKSAEQEANIEIAEEAIERGMQNEMLLLEVGI